MLTGLWLHDEKSFNTYHQNYDRIAKVAYTGTSPNVKVKPGVSMSRALPKIEAVFKQMIPSAPFDYQFADEDYATKFASEVRMSKLAGLFAALAIFISCLGLFGLASFTAEQRTKEIGIRKVLGASVFRVWRLLSRSLCCW